MFKDYADEDKDIRQESREESQELCVCGGRVGVTAGEDRCVCDDDIPWDDSPREPEAYYS